MIEITYFAAFLVGLFGGVHCVGMCGGIVGALSFGLPEQARGKFSALLPYLLNYNLGRLFSYTVAGALFGGIGALAANMVAVNQAQTVLQVIAGLFMVAMGLYLGGWWFGMSRLEKLGGKLWRFLEPYGRRVLPVKRPSQAILMGVIWGWLPCGLVYSALIWAIAAGSAFWSGDPAQPAGDGDICREIDRDAAPARCYPSGRRTGDPDRALYHGPCLSRQLTKNCRSKLMLWATSSPSGMTRISKVRRCLSIMGNSAR